MIIPDKLKVGGMVYDVKKDHKFTDVDLSGVAIHSLSEIRLSQIAPSGERYPRQKIEEVFMHELLHCVDCVYNNNSLDEKVIYRLSQGLYQVFKDNGMLTLEVKDG